jgi:hypothetical protein
MQRRRAGLAVYEGIEIAERDWLICGLLWIAIGTFAVTPFRVTAWAGRVLFLFTLCLHTVEAVYVAFRVWMAGLSPRKWFLKTMVLGFLALLTIETHLRRAPRRRLPR